MQRHDIIRCLRAQNVLIIRNGQSILFGISLKRTPCIHARTQNVARRFQSTLTVFTMIVHYSLDISLRETVIILKFSFVFLQRGLYAHGNS